MEGIEASSAFRFSQNTNDGIAGLDFHSQRIRPLPREIAQLPLQNDASKLLLLCENDYIGYLNRCALPKKTLNPYVRCKLNWNRQDHLA